jgi:hypothetical protein
MKHLSLLEPFGVVELRNVFVAAAHPIKPYYRRRVLDDVPQAVQANIVATRYNLPELTLTLVTTFNPGSSQTVTASGLLRQARCSLSTGAGEPTTARRAAGAPDSDPKILFFPMVFGVFPDLQK